MEYLKQFQSYISDNNLPALVSLWQEYCLSDEIDPKELIKILQEIQKSSFATTFGLYVEQILIIWESLPESDDKNSILSLIFDLETTNDKSLADLAINYLKRRFSDDPHFALKLKLVGLREKISFQGAIRSFELLTHMKVGNFFLHTGGWGVGEVVDVSMLREQLTLEFDFVSGNKEISFANAFKTLIPIMKDHFLSRRFGDPENFEAFARKNPVETIRLLLRDLGPKTAAEIKDELADLVIPEDEWTKWWQAARAKLKKDTFIESPESLKEPFRLRSMELSHEERFQRALATNPEPKELIEMVYAFIRDFPVSLKNETFKEGLKKQLIETLSQRELDDAEEIQMLFILQDLGHEKAKNLKEIVKKLSLPEKLIDHIYVLAYKKRLLSEIKQGRTDWDLIFANLLFAMDINTVRDFLVEELLQAKKEALIDEKIEKLLENPTSSPNGFLWYFQKIMTTDNLPFATVEGKHRFFEALFVLLHQIETNPKMRDLVKKIYTFLTAGRFANVRALFQAADIVTVKEILLLSTKCQTLSDQDLKILHSLAEVVHPSLSKLRKKDFQEEEEHIIWTTEEGYKKIKERIEQIATVETVENAKEIEIARSHGDLRENSEFKFAQEKRARLQSELRFLSDQIKQMRVLTEQDIDISKVSVGTVVTLENKKGEKLTYTILGPWDTNPEQNVLSSQSKLAKALEGLEVGATCTVQEGEWTVSGIESFLNIKHSK